MGLNIINLSEAFCITHTGVDSVFKTGWFSLKEEWNNPGVLHTVQPVFDIRDHLHDVISTDVTGEYDVTIYASKLLHNRLQVKDFEITTAPCFKTLWV